jgi:predicted ATPase/DNA-binding SARP family transcriptional activator/DNA-binding CsgD family transcriptional regulator
MCPPGSSESVRRSATGESPEAMRIWLLGDFRVSVGSRTIEDNAWRRKKAAALVKLLALAQGHRLHRERIMAVLWPDLNGKPAANNLHGVLHFARGVLEASPANNNASRYLALRGDLLELCPDGPLWVDVEAFEAAATTARRSREHAAYRAAIELYTGELLPEDPYEAWTEEKREWLRGLHLALLLELAGLHEEREEYRPAIEALWRVATEEPTNEEVHVGLMRLHALCGRRREALLQYERLREALREGLDEEPGSASRRLQEEIQAGKFPAAPSPRAAGRPSAAPVDSTRHNLPASLTTFVGRERALLEAKRWLSMTRLLTLTGAGGSGKTRLALELARDLVGTYPDGVWLVELAPLSDPALVPQALAAAVGVHEQSGRPLEDTLADHLRTKNSLLVLDNCEHLVDAAARLAHAVLSACPKLRVLATSREPLGVQGEVVRQVPPLCLPDAEGASSIESLRSTEAVRLFVDRARSRLPDFELTEENAGATVRVCHKLDGIPLAIELAAARLGALAVEQVAQRLEDSLDLLAGGSRTVDSRHQTLKATLDWSHNLLSETEQALFRRLSVFAGGWTLGAAEVVAAGSGIDKENVLGLLLWLVDKSMVVAEAPVNREVRYRLLEPMRKYGRECLEESGEADDVLNRHATFFFTLAHKAEPELRKARQEAWAEQLKREYENLRAALSWVIGSGQTELALRLAKALGPFWYLQGFLREGQRWLEAALVNKDAVPVSIRAKGLSTCAFIALHQGDYKRTVALCEEVLTLPREIVDTADVAATLTNLGVLTALAQTDYERSQALFEEAAGLWRRIGDRVGTVRALYGLGLVAAFLGDHEEAATLHEDCLPLAREVGDKVGIAWSLVQGALAALTRGDYEQAKALGVEGIALARQTGYSHSTVFILRILAASASAQGQPVRWARLWGIAEMLGESIGTIVTPAERQYLHPYFTAARTQLDEAAFNTAFSEGRAMSREQAVEYALGVQEPARPETSKRSPRLPTDKYPADGLTRRERELAVLIGRGLTNRRIAEEMAISERTVETHVSKILRKLGLRSRTQIATRLIEQGLLSADPN